MIQRSRNIDDKISQSICEILDGWSDTLTWEALVDAVEFRLGDRYARQTLHKHERIKQAFMARKRMLSNGEVESRKVANPVLQVSLDRVTRLEAENERLKRENANLLEQFVRWTYNAGLKGFSANFLNQPIPSVNRGQTDRKTGTKRAK